MKTWVLIIVFWSAERPIATATSVYGYATYDECNLAKQQVVPPSPRMMIYANCIYGPTRGMF